MDKEAEDGIKPPENAKRREKEEELIKVAGKFLDMMELLHKAAGTMNETTRQPDTKEKRMCGDCGTPSFINQPVSDLVAAQVVDWVGTANLSVDQKVRIAEALFYKCSELEAYLRKASFDKEQMKKLAGIFIDRLYHQTWNLDNLG